MSSRTKRFVAPWLATVTISVLLVFFQNCTVAPEFKSANGEPTTKGNGTGYEGKPYVNLDVNNECSDKNPVKARIEVNAEGNAFITRANCADVNPAQPIPERELARREAPGRNQRMLIFQSRLFVEEDTTAAADTDRVLLGYCQSLDPRPTLSSRKDPPPLLMDIAVFGALTGSQRIDAEAITRSTYLDSVSFKSLIKPPSILSDGTCQKDRSYLSPLLEGSLPRVSTSALFYSHQTTGERAQQLFITRLAGSTVFDAAALDRLPGGGIPVSIQTNFLQSLITPLGLDAENACESVFTSSASTDSQGEPILGLCYLHSELRGI